MSTIAEKQAVLIEEFEFFDEWMDKYNHIIEMGKAMPVLDAVDKNDDLLVQGCQSKVWLKAEKKGEYVRFFADADAIIAKGIVAMLIDVFDNQQSRKLQQRILASWRKLGLRITSAQHVPTD